MMRVLSEKSNSVNVFVVVFAPIHNCTKIDLKIKKSDVDTMAAMHTNADGIKTGFISVFLVEVPSSVNLVTHAIL